MKKRSLTYILILIAIGMILGLLITIGFVLFSDRSLDSFRYKGLAIIAVSIGLIIGVPISLLVIKRIIWSIQRKKHEVMFSTIGLIPNYTFYSSNCAFYIDFSHNKIAVVTTFNPFKLQIADIVEVEKAWVNDGKMLGGTRMVSFCFMINKITWKVPTFTADVSFSMQSQSVKEGMEKAQRFVDHILVAKNNANNNVETKNEISSYNSDSGMRSLL